MTKAFDYKPRGLYQMNFVYAIKNLDTNKIYVGSTKNIVSRIATHFTNLKGGYHPNKAMQADHKKDTKYSVYVLDVVPPNIRTTDREHEWMYILRTYDPLYGYNGDEVSAVWYTDHNKLLTERIFRGTAEEFAGERPSNCIGVGWV